jgi:hypothetical protein
MLYHVLYFVTVVATLHALRIWTHVIGFDISRQNDTSHLFTLILKSMCQYNPCAYITMITVIILSTTVRKENQFCQWQEIDRLCGFMDNYAFKNAESAVHERETDRPDSILSY